MTDVAANDREGRRVPWGRWVARSLIVVAVAFSVHLVWVAGIEGRRWTYEHTTQLRHGEDVSSNLMWGLRAIDDGYLNVYGNVIRESGGEYRLDYVPLRLLVMRQWAAWARQNYPDNRRLQRIHPQDPSQAGWRREYAFTQPLLMFNASVEALGSVAAFLLVWTWVRRSEREERKRAGLAVGLPPWKGAIAGAAAAMLMWFSPAGMISGQGWPSSDVWVAPFFLCAVLLASWSCWLSAGCMMGVAVMFKGQEMIVLPVFLLWPLFMGRPGAMLRFAAGFLLAAGLVVSPWLLRDANSREIDPAAVKWIASAVIASVLLVLQAALRKPAWLRPVILGIAAVLLAWPWLGLGWYVLLAMLAIAAIITLGWWLPLQKQGYLAAGVLGLAIATLPLRFNSDLSWYEVAFHYGSIKFPEVGQFGSNTLPGLLNMRFEWYSWDAPVMEWPIELTLHQAMTTMYAICLVAAAVGLAMHTRRPDRRFLAAATLPWLAAYAFMPHMHGRYLVFGSATGAILAGLGVGGALLDLALIALAWIGVVYLMLDAHTWRPQLMKDYFSPEWADPMANLVRQSIPDSAWAVLLLVGTVLFIAVGQRRRMESAPVFVPAEPVSAG